MAVVAKVDLFDALGLADAKAPSQAAATEEKQKISIYEAAGHSVQASPTASSGTPVAYTPDAYSGGVSSLVLPDVLPASSCMSDLDAYLWAAMPPLPFGAADATVPALQYAYPENVDMLAYQWGLQSQMYQGMDYYQSEASAVAPQTHETLLSTPCMQISPGSTLSTVPEKTDKDTGPSTPTRRASSFGDALKVTPNSTVSTAAPHASPALTVEEDMMPSKVALPPPMVLRLSEALQTAAIPELPRGGAQNEAQSPGEILLNLVQGRSASTPTACAEGVAQGAALLQQIQAGNKTPSTAASDCEADSSLAPQKQRRRTRGGKRQQAEPQPVASAQPATKGRLGRRAKNGERRAPLPLSEERV